MTTRLNLYNGALLLAGDRRLSSLTESREPRHLLDLVWDDGGVRFCLEQAQWHFAMRSQRLEKDPTVTPGFGYQYAFNKPTDWVLTSGVFSEEYMNTPLTDYADEVSYWFADVDEIWVRFVSDHADYGGDLAAWPASFVEYAKCYFASRIVHKLPGSSERISFIFGPPGHPTRGWLHQSLVIAKNKAAMAEPASFPSRGTWAQARHRGRLRSSRDGGSITNLTG